MQLGTKTHAPLSLGTNTATALSLSGQQLSLADVFVQNAGDSMTGALTIQTTSTQLNLAYDGSNSASLTTSSSGALTLTPKAGSNLNISLSTTGDFAVNSNQLYVDTSTGNVGIGTTNPETALHVVKPSTQLRLGYNSSNYSSFSTDSTGALNIATTGTGTNSITLSAIGGNINFQQTNNAITYQGSILRPYTVDDNEISLGSTTARWKDLQVGTGSSSFAGNVGIGTTSPGAKTHIVAADGSNGQLRFGFDNSNYGSLISKSNGDVHLTSTSGYYYISGNFGGSNFFRVGPSGQLAVNSSVGSYFTGGGNVGIGTTNPDSKTVVYGSNPVLNIQNIASSAGDGGVLRFGHNQSGSTIPIAELRGELTNGAGAGSRAGDLSFWTSTAGTLSESMRISAAGSVGIGTTSPSTKLHVVGATTIDAMTAPSSPSSDKVVLYVEASGTTPSRVINLIAKFEDGSTTTIATTTV